MIYFIVKIGKKIERKGQNAMNDIRYPSIGSEFVELVEKMRKLQKEFADLKQQNAGGWGGHAERRLGQQMAAAQNKVDDWLARYQREITLWEKWNAGKKTDEIQGEYKVTLDE